MIKGDIGKRKRLLLSSAPPVTVVSHQRVESLACMTMVLVSLGGDDGGGDDARDGGGDHEWVMV